MASWVGVGAGRRHVSAPTRGATPAAAVAALCPLAVVAADGGGQTFSSLKGNPRLSGRIREGSCVRYHFQLLRLYGLYGFDIALSKTNFSFVVIRMGKLEQGFQLTVYFLANLGRISLGLLRKIDFRQGICRVSYRGKFVFQSLQGLAILSVVGH